MTRAYTTVAIAGAVLLLAGALYLWRKGIAGAARGAVNLATDTIGGAVVGVGDAIGIPSTNMSECERLLAAGSYWQASFKCPAGVYLKGLFGDAPQAVPATSSAAIASSTGSAAPGAFAPAPELPL